jgi:hypothetical protein
MVERLDAMQAFTRVVALRSFTKAAALLGLPQARLKSVTHRVGIDDLVDFMVNGVDHPAGGHLHTDAQHYRGGQHRQ